MASPQEEQRPDAELERIDSMILPCVALALDSLIGLSAGPRDATRMAAELRALAGDMDVLTGATARLVEVHKGIQQLRSAA